MKTINEVVCLFNIFLMFNLINCHIKPSFFKCIHNIEEELNPITSVTAESSIKGKEQQKRRIDDTLDAKGFKNFNIHLDLENIKNDIKLNKLEEYEDFFISSMEKAVSVLETLLKVKPLENNYKLSNKNFGELKISKWDESKFGDNAPGFTDQGIDLAIFGMLADLGEGTLATASAKAFQEETVTNIGQPYVGLVKINKLINYTLPNAKTYFQAILVHEFTHILGFSKNFFEKYYKNIVTKVDEYGIMRSYLNSPKVLEVARKYFNCPTLEGVELENQGGNGTEGSHWEARILLGEYMNGYSYTEEMVISEFTLAVLEDSGYYKANYYTGGLMRFGKHKGCEFLKQRCINTETNKTKFENEFFDNDNSLEASCSSGRQSRTYNLIYEISEEYQVPDEYKYIPGYFGYLPADYCPVSLKYNDEEDKAYFSGHCSNYGSGYYGSLLYYYSYSFDGTSSALSKVTGEKNSDHSFCFLSSLAKSSDSNSDLVSKVVRANCYEMFCSSQSLTLKIFDDYIVCPRAGGKIEVDGYKGYLLCPDYNLMCSGTVLCNDIFDCIDKKSEIKDHEYIYDYEIETSQNIKKSNNAELSLDNYELSDDGKCPINCVHCKGDNKNCLKCRDGYVLYFDKNKRAICSDPESLTTGVFLNETTGIYENCMDNCIVCSDKETCMRCKSDHMYKLKKCELPKNSSKLIAHGFEYNENEDCIKCEIGYGFNQTNRDKCLKISTELNSYYSRDNDTSFYPCSKSNKNCTKCYYDKDQGVKCQKCIDDLILLDKLRGLCKTKEEVTKAQYYMINDTHAGECSTAIPNCLQCNNQFTCDKCKYGYEFISEVNNETIRIECVPKEEAKEIKTNNKTKEEGEGDDKGLYELCDSSDLSDCFSYNYFSLLNILVLQTIYVMLLFINF